MSGDKELDVLVGTAVAELIDAMLAGADALESLAADRETGDQLSAECREQAKTLESTATALEDMHR